MTLLELHSAKSDLAAVERLLSELPEDSFIERLGLESRKTELAALVGRAEGLKGRVASAALFFDGTPVVDTRGIDAEFATQAIERFQDLVTKVRGSHERGGALGGSGPVPASKDAHLHITNVVHGSFGFELTELGSAAPLFEPSPLAVALDESLELFAAACGDDDAFADVTAEGGLRVYESLRSFIETLDRAHATIRILGHQLDQRLTHQALKTALERVSEKPPQESELTVEGTLLGLLPISHQFEFQRADSVEIIKGRVGRGLNISSWHTLLQKPVRANLALVKWTRGVREFQRFTLWAILPR